MSAEVRSSHRTLTALGLLGALAGCSIVLGVDSERYVVPQSPVPDAAAVDPWACLSAPNQRLDANLHVDVALLVMDALQPSISAGGVDGGSDLDTVSGTVLSGVTVRACDTLDVDCTGGSAPVVTSDGGAAEFHLAGDFAGFFNLSRPDLVPATLYPGNLLAGQTMASFPAYDISPSGFMFLANSVIGSDVVSLDPNGTLGHALVTIYDCQDHQAPGVTLTYSSTGRGTKPFYFSGGLPMTNVMETDGFGLGGAINLPTGALTVRAVLAANRTAIGSTTFVVRPGAITFAWIRVRTH